MVNRLHWVFIAITIIGGIGLSGASLNYVAHDMSNEVSREDKRVLLSLFLLTLVGGIGMGITV